MSWRSVIDGASIILGSTDRGRRRRLDDVNNSGGQPTQAYHAAALRSRGLMRSAGRSRRFVGDIRYIFVAVMRMTGGMFVHMPALVGVLRRSLAKLMNMHHAQTVGRRPQPVRKREGDARRKHAKHIGQGEQPPCLQSLRSGQTHEHSVLNLAIRTRGAGSLRGNAFTAKCEHSPLEKFRGAVQRSARPTAAISPAIFFLGPICRRLLRVLIGMLHILARKGKSLRCAEEFLRRRDPLHCPPD